MNCQALRWQWLTFYKVNLLKFIIHAYRKVQQILSIQLDTLLSKSRITTTQFMKYIISFSEVCSSRLNLFKGGGCSVAQSCPTLRLHGPQPTRLPCPSLSPAVCSDPCPLSQWCHPTISSFAPSSPLALSISQHWGLFQWAGSSLQVAKYWSILFLNFLTKELWNTYSFVSGLLNKCYVCEMHSYCWAQQ